MKSVLRIFSVLFVVALPSLSIAKETVVAATPPTGLETQVVLAYVNALLAIIMLMLTRVLIKSVNRESMKKKSSQIVNASAWLLIGASSISTAFAQADPNAPVNPALMYASAIYWTLIIVGIMQIIIIYALIDGIDKITNPPIEGDSQESAFMKWFAKVNNFQPMEQEANIDTGHEYDGIRELNNATPTWFTTAFILSIVFAVVYLYRHHVSLTAPLQLQEFATEMKEGDAKVEAYLKTQANNVDENSVKMLGTADIENGATVYKANCLACHGAKGEGLVGPNLTDDYWLHGGSLSDVFKSIKYGWQDNGMKPWKDDLSAIQIAQLTSYIKSLAGTNPPNAKAPQGKIHQETAK